MSIATTAIYLVAGALFTAGALFALIRVVRGPTILDRVIGSDVLLTTLMLVLGAEMVINGHTRTVPLMMSPTRSLNSLKIIAFSARRICCINACLAYWEAMRPKPVGVTSSSSSSPMIASGLTRRASNWEI